MILSDLARYVQLSQPCPGQGLHAVGGHQPQITSTISPEGELNENICAISTMLSLLWPREGGREGRLWSGSRFAVHVDQTFLNRSGDSPIGIPYFVHTQNYVATNALLPSFTPTCLQLFPKNTPGREKTKDKAIIASWRSLPS